jgi:hypothetical protein
MSRGETMSTQRKLEGIQKNGGNLGQIENAGCQREGGERGSSKRGKSKCLKQETKFYG